MKPIKTATIEWFECSTQEPFQDRFEKLFCDKYGEIHKGYFDDFGYFSDSDEKLEDILYWADLPETPFAREGCFATDEACMALLKQMRQESNHIAKE